MSWLADSTAGWLVSWTVGPHTSTAQLQYGPVMILFTVIIVSVVGAFFGLVGALVRKIIGRRTRFVDA